MWARPCIVVLLVLSSCYTPHAVPGTPCTPAEANCPEPLTCEPVGDHFECSEGPAVDAAIDTRIDDAPRDTGIDGPAAAPWQLVQATTSDVGIITIEPSGPGHLLVLGIETNSQNPVASVTDDMGNSYVKAVRSIHDNADLGVEIWYAANAKTARTLVAQAVDVRATVAWEVANIRSNNPLDRVANLDDRPPSTVPVGAPIATTAGGDFVVTIAIVENQVTDVHAGNPFTNDQTANGNGWAHLASISAPPSSYQAQWDQPTAGASCSTTAAFLVGP